MNLFSNPVVIPALKEIRERFEPFLKQRIIETGNPRNFKSCAKRAKEEDTDVEEVYCCEHYPVIAVPYSAIRRTKDLATLRAYAHHIALAGTTCGNYEVLAAVNDLGILFESVDYFIWQELLRCKKLEEVFWLELSVCQETGSVHPAWKGEVYEQYRQNAKDAFILKQLKEIYKWQNERDSAIDSEYDATLFAQFVKDVYDQNDEELNPGQKERILE